MLGVGSSNRCKPVFRDFGLICRCDIELKRDPEILTEEPQRVAYTASGIGNLHYT